MTVKKSSMVSGMNFATEFINDLFKTVVKLGGTEEQIFDAFKTGSEFIQKCAKIIVQTKDEIKDRILNLISSKESVVIDAVDGSQTLAQASDVFAENIGEDFTDYGTDKPGQATEKTNVLVYEMAKNANFAQMFGSLNSNLDKLCFTQHQVKQFCKQHQQWLRTDGYSTFFLFKENNEFFVAHVHLLSDGKLSVYVDLFEDNGVCYADLRHRVVVPQLQKLNFF